MIEFPSFQFPTITVQETILGQLTFVGLLLKNAGIGMIFGAVGLPVVVGVIPFLLGFTVGGIATGSIAAFCMAFHAGYVPIGGFLATMQSIGSVGLKAGFNRFTVIIGAILGGLVGVNISLH